MTRKLEDELLEMDQKITENQGMIADLQHDNAMYREKMKDSILKEGRLDLLRVDLSAVRRCWHRSNRS